MPIKIISPTRVEVDGTDAGLLVDFILANPTKRNEIANELADWHGTHVREDQRRENELKSALKESKESLESAKKDLEKKCKEHESAHEAKTKALTDASEHRANEFLSTVRSAATKFLADSDTEAVLRAKKKAELEAQLAELR